MAKRNFVVSTRDDNMGVLTVDYAPGLPAACKLARRNAESMQAGSRIVDARTGKLVGTFKYDKRINTLIKGGRIRNVGGC